jgi:NTP pyrophosphatase (non-canonical NTP hydrolase)
MTEKDIIDAYCRIRTIDNTIPDDVLDFMKDASIEKMEEELREVKEAYDLIDPDKLAEEITDLMTVCVMCLKHFNRDPIEEFEKVCIKNEKRVK